MATEDSVAPFSSSALFRHPRVSDKLKAQIQSGEYVNVATVSHVSGPDTSSVTSARRQHRPNGSCCPKDRVTRFRNIHCLLKVVSHNTWPTSYHVSASFKHYAMYKRGADWRMYGKAFRSMRLRNDWAWYSLGPLWMDV